MRSRTNLCAPFTAVSRTRYGLLVDARTGRRRRCLKVAAAKIRFASGFSERDSLSDGNAPVL